MFGPNSLGIVVVIALSFAGLAAAEGDPALPYPADQVEDPIGLGPRLALIDHMREQLDLDPAPGASMEQLLAMYWGHHGSDALAIVKGEVPPSQRAAAWEAKARAQERAWKLRTTLRDRHQVEVDDGATVEELEALLARFDAKVVREQAEAATRSSAPTTSGAGDPGIAAAVEAGGDGPIDRWRSTVIECWQRYAELTVPWQPRYPGDVLPAERDGFRIETAGGAIEYREGAPAGPDGIARYWWPRLANGRAATARVWQPASWDDHTRQWLTVPLEHHRLYQVNGHWMTLMNAIFKHPEVDGDASSWMQRHQAQVRGDAGDCAELFAPYEQALGIDLVAAQAEGLAFDRALGRWNSYERALPACRTANTEPSTPAQRAEWLERVRAVMTAMAAERAAMEGIVGRIARGR